MLTAADFHLRRTPTECRAWADNYFQAMKAQPGGLRKLRFNTGLNKKIKEEVMPVVRLFERRPPSPGSQLTFPVDCGLADAWLHDASGISIPLQVTCDFSYQEALRLELLHQQGIAPGFGSVSRQAGRINADRRAYDTQEAIDHFSRVLTERIVAKFKGTPDPGTWLVVQCVDEALPDSGIEPVMQACAAAAVGSPYDMTFIVGTDGGRALCRKI
jgi:hypothetical protein